MKRIIVCADGTWNSDDAPAPKHTNVSKLHRAVAPAANGVAQVAYYQDGVGTAGGRLDRLVGGAFGRGLSDNVQACYRFLVDTYEPGDELFLFGFSRGAYTARSLAGLVRNAGVLRREHRDRVGEAYDLYRDRADDAHPNGDRARDFRARYAREDLTPITCLGVWDTVGSLGIPTNGPLGRYLREKYSFHDVDLSGQVRNAFHALAVDERRKPFAPTLWTAAAPVPGQRVEQVWFAGAHSNVGGGYEECGPSDHALRWMMQRAGECGLAWQPGALEALSDVCDAPLADSMSDFYRKLGEHRRPIARPQRHPRTGAPVHTFESVHESVWARMRAAPPPGGYAPPNLVEYLRAQRVPATHEPATHAPATGPAGSDPLSYRSLQGLLDAAAAPAAPPAAPRSRTTPMQ